MTTTECIILLTPFFTLLAGMFLAFGFAHYNDNKRKN